MTLGEYASTRSHVCACWTSIAIPTGEGCRIGSPEDDRAESCDWLSLEGEVDEAGIWAWDGYRPDKYSPPFDPTGSSVTRLVAWPDPSWWEALAEDE
jgi:hypothetical protein